MTTLLMLLLLVGQPKCMPDCHHPEHTAVIEGQPHDEWATNDSTAFRVRINGPDTTRIVAITNVLLFEYGTECYNDSTEHTKRGWVPASEKAETLGIIKYYTPHRAPTFPDFLKWLHRRTEAKQ